jgi:hypothetical protein
VKLSVLSKQNACLDVFFREARILLGNLRCDGAMRDQVENVINRQSRAFDNELPILTLGPIVMLARSSSSFIC